MLVVGGGAGGTFAGSQVGSDFAHSMEPAPTQPSGAPDRVLCGTSPVGHPYFSSACTHGGTDELVVAAVDVVAEVLDVADGVAVAVVKATDDCGLVTVTVRVALPQPASVAATTNATPNHLIL